MWSWRRARLGMRWSSSTTCPAGIGRGSAEYRWCRTTSWSGRSSSASGASAPWRAVEGVVPLAAKSRWRSRPPHAALLPAERGGAATPARRGDGGRRRVPYLLLQRSGLLLSRRRPHHEEHECCPVNPCGRTKLGGEQMLADVTATGLRHLHVGTSTSRVPRSRS